MRLQRRSTSSLTLISLAAVTAKTTDNMEFVARDAKRTVNLVAIAPDYANSYVYLARARCVPVT